MSIVLRFGVGEAFVRFYYDDADPERRDRIARTTTAFVMITTTVTALVAAALAGPLSELVLGFRDATLMSIAVAGCGRSRTSSSPTRCCAWTSVGAPM